MASSTRSVRKRSKKSEDVPEDLGLQASGFKFSRQSRYRKVNQKKGSATKSVRKNRRSSFAQGRKKRKSLLFSSAPEKSELYKEIPIDLPPEARLRKLFEACLKDAVEKLDSNLSECNVDGIPNFADEAKEVFTHLQALISESEIIDEALKPPNSEVKQIPNPKNQELEAKLTSCLAVTERLKTENEKWDTLLSFRQEQVAKKERRQDEDFKATDQCPDFLSPEQHQLLSGKPSMKGFTERLSTMKQETVTQVNTIAQAISVVSQYEEAAKVFVDNQVKTFSNTTFEGTNQVGTPRTVIPRLLMKLF
ncbi:hypothetical protein ABFA07_001167 [Porites harrisoni]